jgi:hypothetical protein
MGNKAVRWSDTGLREAETEFRKVNDFRKLGILYRKPNPSLTQQQ